jgi:apolipoprotein D and lipocalin family protein
MTTELEKFSSAYEPAPNLSWWRRTASPRRRAPGIRAVNLFRACLLLAMAAFMAPVAAAQQPLTVVSNLDPKRYAGEWFEIARFPNRFQDKCVGDVVARYEIRPEGGLVVINRCKQADGRITDARGIARTVKGAPPSVLEVRFAPAFLSFLPNVWGDYQVMALDDAHTYSLVGTPDRKYLWVLSRTPKIDASLYDRLLTVAGGQGFDVSKLVRTPQADR